MGVKIKGEYLGNTVVSLKHESGREILTCAPKDNRGDGSKFSPTDLTVGALGACIVTIMSFVAEDDGIEFKCSFEAEKIMKASPRMIERIILSFDFASGIPDKTRKKIEKAADLCPVKRSLNPEIEISLKFNYN